MEEKISGISSGRETRLEVLSMNWPRVMAAKKGDEERMSAWAAKRRAEGPIARVIIGDVRFLRDKRCY